MRGIDPDVRKGFSNVEVTLDVDAECEQKDALVAATKCSAGFDMLSNPTEVNVSRSAWHLAGRPRHRRRGRRSSPTRHGRDDVTTRGAAFATTMGNAASVAIRGRIR